jgi:hypothetical protein
MTKTMVERVARAMRKELHDSSIWGPDTLELVVLDGGVPLMAMARAAIAAMREPTEAMTKAAFAATFDDGVAHWIAMIDAVLADQDTAGGGGTTTTTG